jgi:radical SAM superfamily enzyme YgiQ (UPF0313 family)
MWRGYRPRSVENVLEELRYLMQKYSPKWVTFIDDTFAADRDRAIRLCRAMRQKGLDVPWSAITRVGRDERKLLHEMYRAGCRSLYFGAESGDDSTLRTIKKGTTTSQIESTVKMALEIGFQVVCSFVINLPFETPEGARTTISFAKKLKGMGAHIQAHTLFPYPGTDISNNMGKYNLSLKHQGQEFWKIASDPLYLEDRPSTPLLSNNLISEEELATLWPEVTSLFCSYSERGACSFNYSCRIDRCRGYPWE